jgi:hypothetical protein
MMCTMSKLLTLTANVKLIEQLHRKKIVFGLEGRLKGSHFQEPSRRCHRMKTNKNLTSQLTACNKKHLSDRLITHSVDRMLIFRHFRLVAKANSQTRERHAILNGDNCSSSFSRLAWSTYNQKARSFLNPNLPYLLFAYF